MADATYHGAERHEAGAAMTGLGDIDGDGYTEFAIGAPQAEYGSVYLMIDPPLTGTHNLSDTADTTFHGQSVAEDAGISLAGNIDLNHDGFSDLVIGAPMNGSSGYEAGATYAVYGPLADRAGGSLSGADAAFQGTDLFEQSGSIVLGGHDWSGDGVDDLATAAPKKYRTLGTPNSGEVYVFFGRGL